MDRREFLKFGSVSAAAAAIGIEGILEARRAPAFAQGTKLHIVRWVDFIPESDVELKRQMPEAGKALGAEVTLETINANDLPARLTAAIQSKSGPDVFMLQYNQAHLYVGGLADVSDVANEVSKDGGGFYDVYKAADQINGKWMAVPHAIVGNAVAYRKSMLKEVGATAFPKTWDEARRVFAQLKKKGRPYGQTLGHTFGDAPTFCYPMIWAFGAAETDKTGKKVVLNGKEAVESVKFMQAFWKECCDEGALAWDDTNNNRAFHAGEISATLNGASIYIVAKRQKEKIKDDKGEPMWQDIDHHDPPAGPKGAFTMYFPISHGVMSYSKNPKLAKDLLRFIHKKDNYEKWFQTQGGYSVGPTHVWEKNPMWETVDAPLKMFRQAARNTRIFGYEGPATAKSTEVFNKYIVIDMYAKAVQGMSAEDAVKWADGELRKAYEG